MAIEVVARKRNLKNKRKNSEDESSHSSTSRQEKNGKELSNSNIKVKKNLRVHNLTSKSSSLSILLFIGLNLLLMLSVGLMLVELHVKQKGLAELLQLYFVEGPIKLSQNMENAKFNIENDAKIAFPSMDSNNVLNLPAEDEEKEYFSNIKEDSIEINELLMKNKNINVLAPIKEDLSTDGSAEIKLNEVIDNEIVFNEKGFDDKLSELESQIIPDINVDEVGLPQKSKPDKVVKNVDMANMDDNKKVKGKQEDEKLKETSESNFDQVKEKPHTKLLDLYIEVEKLTEEILSQDPENDKVLELAPHLEGVIGDINSNKLSGIEESLLHIKTILLDLHERLEETKNLKSGKLKENDKYSVHSPAHSISNDSHDGSDVVGKIPVDEVIPDPIYIAPRGGQTADGSSIQSMQEDSIANLHINVSTKDKKADHSDNVEVENIADSVIIDSNDNFVESKADSVKNDDTLDNFYENKADNVIIDTNGNFDENKADSVINDDTHDSFDEIKADSIIIDKLTSKNRKNVEVSKDKQHLDSKFNKQEETKKIENLTLKYTDDDSHEIESKNEIKISNIDIDVNREKAETLSKAANAKMMESKIEITNIKRNSNSNPDMETQKLNLNIADSNTDVNNIDLSDNFEVKTTGIDSTNENLLNLMLKNNVNGNNMVQNNENIEINLLNIEGEAAKIKLENINTISNQNLEYSEVKLEQLIENKETTKKNKNEEIESLTKASDNKLGKENDVSVAVENTDYPDQPEAKGNNINVPLKDRHLNDDVLIMKDPAQALEIFTHSLLMNPKEISSLFGRAKALAKLAENEQSNTLLEKSIMAYFDVINLLEEDSEIVNKELLKEAVETCIEKLYFRGWRQKVVPLLLKVMKHFQNEPQLLNQLGRAYLMTNDNADALKIFQTVLQTWPDNGFAQVHYGFILKITNKNLTEAIEYLHRGILSGEEGTVDGRFYLHLGDAYQRIGKNKEAYKIYDDGTAKGLFLSRYQRSLHNIDRLKAKPVWTVEETTYSHFFRKLEANWEKIMAEGLSVLDIDPPQGFKPESELLRKTGEWSQFDLFARGVKNVAHCLQVPFTCSLVEQFPPAAKNKRGQIKFSLLLPGTTVFNHTGPTNCRLRAHLGLITPTGAALKVLNNTLSWEAGKIFVFDDSFEHEVWHKGNSMRLILIVDVWHPEITEEEKLSLTPI